MAQIKKIESILRDALLNFYELYSVGDLTLEELNVKLVAAIRMALMYLKK